MPGGLANHHVFGHIETQFLRKSLELLNLIVSDGTLLSDFEGFDFDGSDSSEEIKDCEAFIFWDILNIEKFKNYFKN